MLTYNIKAWYITEVAGNAIIVYKEMINMYRLVKKLKYLYRGFVHNLIQPLYVAFLSHWITDPYFM